MVIFESMNLQQEVFLVGSLAKRILWEHQPDFSIIGKMADLDLQEKMCFQRASTRILNPGIIILLLHLRDYKFWIAKQTD